jgi:hypothetical protein
MKRRSRVCARTILTIAALATATAMTVSAQEAKDQAIADLVGEWQISYTNGSGRLYSIDRQGLVSFEREKMKGRVIRKSEALLLLFAGDARIERLTMGTDGRLFVEHFPQQADLLGKTPEIMGIGIRQK